MKQSCSVVIPGLRGLELFPTSNQSLGQKCCTVDKPTIQFIVVKALKSGIEDILVVTG